MDYGSHCGCGISHCDGSEDAGNIQDKHGIIIRGEDNAQTANGADGETKTEIESLLGGKLPLENLNEYLYAYVSELPSEKKFTEPVEE